MRREIEAIVSAQTAALVPLLGIATVLAVVANFNFNGVDVRYSAFPSLGACLIVSLLFASRCGWRDLAVVAAVFAVPFIHFIAPAIPSRATLLLADAGDFGQYTAVASWLMTNPISQIADRGADYNFINHFIFYHQQQQYRLNALFLLALTATLTGREVPEVYAAFCAILVGLQAVSVFALARAVFPALPQWAQAALGILYGVSPIVTWAAAASFTAQGLGLSLWVGFVALFFIVIRQRTASRFDIAALGLLLFAAWSSYPEGMPLAIAICGLYFLISRQSFGRWGWTALSVVAIGVLISPQSALWNIQGFIGQFTGLPHGGLMLSTPYRVVATLVGASQQPLIPQLIAEVPRTFEAAGLVVILVSTIGTLVALRRTRVAWAIVASSALLIVAVMFKYRQASVLLDIQPVILAWNLFKAAQYAAPFVTTIALGGALLGALSLQPVWRNASVVVGAAAILTVIFGQDRQLWLRIYRASVDPEIKTIVGSLPKNARVHVDLPQSDAYTRFMIYSLLRQQRVTTAQDGRTPKGHNIPPDYQLTQSAPRTYRLRRTD